jgi:hypothetical protein
MVDARAMSTGAKSGDATSTQAESGTAADFGGQLADLSRQEGKASESAPLASSPNRAGPAFVQQNFLLAVGTAEASSPGRMPATTPDPMLAGASSSVRDSTLAGSTLGFRGDTYVANDVSSPTGNRPATNAIRDSHARSVSGGAEAYVTLPLAAGFPLLSAFTAASQVKRDYSSGTVASSNPTLAGAASVSGANGAMVSLAASSPFPDASRTARRLPLEPAAAAPVRVSIADQQTHFAPLTGLSPAQQMALPVSGLAPLREAVHARGLASSGESVPRAGENVLDGAGAQAMTGSHASLTEDPQNGHGLDFSAPKGLSSTQQMAQSMAVQPTGDVRGPGSSGKSAPDAGERAFDGAFGQDIGEPHASEAADPNGGHGPDPAASASAKVSPADPQASLAPPNGLSPALQIGELFAAQVSPDNLDGGVITVPSSRATVTSGVIGSGLSMSRVQTMQLQQQGYCQHADLGIAARSPC